VPNKNDIVLLDKPVVLRSHSAVIAGLIIERGGGVRGYSSTYRGGLTITDYFKNNGSVGGNLRPFSLGGYIENNGPVSQSNRTYIRGGNLAVIGDLNMQAYLSGPVSLQDNFKTTYALNTQDQTIESNGYGLELNHVNGDLHVVGTSSVVIEGVSNEEVFFGSIVAPSSTVAISSDSARMLGSIDAPAIEINSRVYMPHTHMQFTGNLTVTPLGQIFGNNVHVRQITYFKKNVTNYGTLGPYVQPHISQDLLQVGDYTGQEVRLLGSGVRNIVGVIPARVILGGDQTWNTSPTIGSLSTSGNTLTIPQGNTLHTSGVYNRATILGSGKLIIIDPQGNESVSPNVQAIDAPEATISLQASDSRIGGDITASHIEILNRTIVSQNNTRLEAEQVSFTDGSLVVTGNNAYKRQVTITTDRLAGNGYFGPHTRISLNTSIPTGFTAGYNTEINLFQSNASWSGTYRLSGALTNFLSGVDSVFEYYKSPNLAQQLNSGLPHYYSYQSALGWTNPLSVNASSNPFSPNSSIAKRNFFVFSFVPNQKAGEPVQVTITTPSDPDFSEQIFLSNKGGQIYPKSITFTNGLWQGELELFDTGTGQQVIASGINEYLGHSGRSNMFANIGSANKTGFVRGFVRENNAVRAESGTLLFNSTTDGSEYTVPITELGVYVAEIPAGEYFVQTTNALPVIITVAPEETTNQDIVLNALCESSDKVPVLLVPGIQGSDRIDNDGWFPKLYKDIPAWDSQRLEVHNPTDVIGFELITEELIENGYQENCTVFKVPYEWSISILDSSEQYLKPWIDHAKQVASSTQVDIVAHSMGGLVSRAYIQGDSYENDVRKLAMAGTPNAGSVQSYFSWEGGDPLQADQHAPNSFASNLVQADLFQTNTLERNYIIKTGEKSPCTYKRLDHTILSRAFFEENDIAGCDTVAIKQFLRSMAPAVGELFPTYDFLRNDQLSNIKLYRLNTPCNTEVI